ncbi:uncharacterized protein K444DRAFT_660705 [Hyaloscypha bicolor E]|uniref:CMP/dCMP-type deaminase domain-containing protein n=1 Tax=Hyaloscypha bicolor E TaxID=1095630 RepID=A0A2J6TLX2_9HELO|nr:uncharacterized protein K444DRAFT_660705 [Hyaloscypha bicolor E]PMD64023.1 hypothetical protein K444DRAFT_660705 [Hyaloscypha bicolor E]
MSPRNDMYLSLCLAQAELSPLHYRHGSIIVRGGKVIGQGFNNYRPGFDGGALKSGVLLDGPAIAELKQRLKSKPKSKNKPDHQQDDATFTPFESSGCGPHANVNLSMHSEMMAIRSALSLSSGTLSSQTSARSAKCFEKPCFKLPGDSKKRKARARGLKAYAAAVTKKNDNKSNIKEEDNEFQKEMVMVNVALNTWKSAEKHRPKKKYGYHYQTGYQYEADHYQKPQHKPYQHKCGSEPQLSKVSVKNLRTPDTPSTRSDDDSPPKKPPLAPPKPQQILITKKNSLNTKADVKERTKDFRLKGSDLYVARLGTCQVTPPMDPKPHTSTPPTPTLSPKSEPASLYDELTSISRTPSPSTSPPNPPPMATPEVRASRPCYRCVSAMHAVGIKRVFWTNADGGWEGAKVRDLVEALENGIESDGDGPGTGQENKGVFVTKHEVLMLKRIMGF